MQSMMARQEESEEVISCIGDVMLDRVRPTKCTFFGTDCCLVPRFVFVVVVVVVILKREFLEVWTFLAMDLISTVLDLFTLLIM